MDQDAIAVQAVHEIELIRTYVQPVKPRAQSVVGALHARLCRVTLPARNGHLRDGWRNMFTQVPDVADDRVDPWLCETGVRCRSRNAVNAQRVPVVDGEDHNAGLLDGVRSDVKGVLRITSSRVPAARPGPPGNGMAVSW